MTARCGPIRRYPLAGSVIDAVDQAMLLEVLEEGAAERRALTVLNHNAHSLALVQTDPDLVGIFERADLVFVDGVSALAMGRVAGLPLHYRHRLAVLDWFWPLMELSASRGLRIVHVGSHRKVIDAAGAVIAGRVPGATFTAISGFFDHSPASAGTGLVLEEIRAAQPDVILVGLGMPLQEKWIDAVRPALPSCPVVAVGGVLGFIGGERPTPPRWTGRLGVEWAYRLVTEPRRLAYRYLIEPRGLIRPVARQISDRMRLQPQRH